MVKNKQIGYNLWVVNIKSKSKIILKYLNYLICIIITIM